MISVLLVDDHEIVRTGMRRLLDDQAHIEVLGEASQGEQAVMLAKQLQPQIILMDINMPPGIGGLEASRKILHTHPECKIIILTVHNGDVFPQQLFSIGVKGYLNKSCGIEEVLLACKEVMQGRRYISAKLAREIAEKNILPDTGNVFDKLSAREMQVMLMLTQGLKNQQIADKLYLSPKTVSTYRYRIFDKLGVKNDVELIHLASRYHLINN